MVTRKKAGSKVAANEPTLFEKIGGQAIQLKDEIVAGADHLLEAAGEKFSSVTSSIKDFAAKRGSKTAKPAKAKKSPVKKIAKKVAVVKKKAAKKVAPAKKATVKSIQKATAKARQKDAPKKKVATKKVSRTAVRRRASK